MTTISKNMKLADLRSVSFFAGCTEAELKVVRTCLVMTQDGVALSAASPADLEMVRAHAVASESGAGVLSVASVEATFARSSIQFLHWNRRTAEWFLGIGTPPLASDGKRGGWIFFEIKADSAEEAKALAERFINSPGATFTGGTVCLKDSLAYVRDKAIAF